MKSMKRSVNDGVITVEESKTLTPRRSRRSMHFDPWLPLPYFINDIDRQDLSSKTPFLIHENKITR